MGRYKKTEVSILVLIMAVCGLLTLLLFPFAIVAYPFLCLYEKKIFPIGILITGFFAFWFLVMSYLFIGLCVVFNCDSSKLPPVLPPESIR